MVELDEYVFIKRYAFNEGNLAMKVCYLASVQCKAGAWPFFILGL